MDESGESRTHRLRLRALCSLIAIAVLVGLIFATHFLIDGVQNDGGSAAVALGVLLLATSGVETAAMLGLARLRPAMWYGGMAAFGTAALLALYVLVVDPRLLSAIYLATTAGVAVGVYFLRPLYTPGTEVRRHTRAGGPVIDGAAAIRKVRRSDPSVGMKLFVGYLPFAATVAFYKGVQLFWLQGDVPTYVGAVYVVFALMQIQACYGLWIGRPRAWFLSMALCLIVTLVAAYHALVAEDLISVLIFAFEASNVVYLYRKREEYVPHLTIDATPG